MYTVCVVYCIVYIDTVYFIVRYFMFLIFFSCVFLTYSSTKRHSSSYNHFKIKVHTCMCVVFVFYYLIAIVYHAAVLFVCYYLTGTYYI